MAQVKFIRTDDIRNVELEDGNFIVDYENGSIYIDKLNNVQPAPFVERGEVGGATPVNNTKTTTEYETYSCNYTNALEQKINGTILWTNNDPTTNFSASTITLNESLDNYDMYEIIFRQSATNVRMMNTGKIPVGSGTILNYVTGSNYYRPTNTTVSGNTIAFEDARTVTNGVTNVENNNIIPMYIIGYKTGLFDV